MKKAPRATREEWPQRVDRWLNSNKSARAFAAEIGVNEKTLAHWTWRLRGSSVHTAAPRQRQGGEKASRPQLTMSGLPFVELPRQRDEALPTSYEVVLSGGRLLRVPASFQPEALSRLIAAVETV